jgi:fructokinase
MSLSQRPVIFGEVLFDVFPDGTEVLGGAPFNVAWHLQAFGRKPLFVSRVGNDALGRAIRAAMQDWEMETAGLQMDSTYPTGLVKISLAGGEPTFDILPERAYDRIDAESLPPMEAGALLYHGSLALRGETSRAAFERIRERHAPRRFVDVNLRRPWWEAGQVLDLLEGAAWAKINGDELAALVPEAGEPMEQAGRLQERFGLETLYVTEGAAGAFARTPDGDFPRVHPAAEVQVVDAVGAGDAFASVLILGILSGWPLQQTLNRAQDFASAIVGRRGATVRDPGLYRAFRQVWGC